MIQRSENLRFPLEAREPIRIEREQFGQDLQRDITIELGVPRAIHLAHAARAKGASDFVRADSGAGSKAHALTSDFELQTYRYLSSPAQRLVQHLGETSDERGDIAFVHGVRDGDRVGQEQPDRRRRQQDADDRNHGEQAGADTLEVHGTSSTILPN
jgi:hypothetical protein